jgi:hypothetical protein
MFAIENTQLKGKWWFILSTYAYQFLLLYSFQWVCFWMLLSIAVQL